MEVGKKFARVGINFAANKTTKTIMDYEQDYSHVNNNEQHWCELSSRESATSLPSEESASSASASQGDASALDNEDFA